MDAFEPPKYLTSLITAVNDGAKAAQASALSFLLVGLYLLATAFSASDEDLLLGKAVTISQIGASLPVGFSFAIAPLVFVFLHIYTLVRYDFLAANVRQFRTELHNTVPLEADRERCRQLLANVEFIMVLTTPRNSALYSGFWKWLFRGIVAAFPVAVLLIVQINALRYQSDPIIWVQRFCLAVDLYALVSFFRRNTLDGSGWPERRPPRIMRRWARLLWAPILIGAVNLVYLDTVPGDADVRLVRYDQPEPSWFHYMAGNPLDIMLCPQLHWGCRFLRIDHRTLVDKVRDEKAMSILWMDRSKLVTVLAQEMPGIDSEQAVSLAYARSMAAIEGVFLRGRSLRFAVLDASRLYAADLIGARLQNASFKETDLRAAKLVGDNLQGADLSDTNLNDANLPGAYMFAANLSSAQLIGADLNGAILINANLLAADLTRAKMFTAVVSSQQPNKACGVEAILPKWADRPGFFSLKPCPLSMH